MEVPTQTFKDSQKIAQMMKIQDTKKINLKKQIISLTEPIKV